MGTHYDQVGGVYNITRKSDPFLADRLFAHLSPSADGLYLDVGCGTGNYTDALQKRGCNLIGLDPSKVMLEQAMSRNVHIDWRVGQVEKLDLENASIDGVIATLTVHHWKDLGAGFVELGRVLKPGGILILFTSSPEQMQTYWLNHYFPQMMLNSIRQMPAFSAIRHAMDLGGIEWIETEEYFVQTDLQDHFLQCGKDRPELYFDKTIQAGISSFVSLSNREEVAHGLSALRSDLDNGNFDAVKRKYESDQGDYTFIIGKKKY